MFGLSVLGTWHTAISLVALVSGFWALARHRQISPREAAGALFIGTTVLTIVTAPGFIRDGSIGTLRALSIVPMSSMALGLVAAFTPLFGRWSTYLQAIGFSTALACQVLPGITEALVRLPPGDPVMEGFRDPALRPIQGTVIALSVVGIVWQLRWLYKTAPRKKDRQA